MTENLHDWVEQKRVDEEKPARYKSKHDPNVRLVQSSFNPDFVGDDYAYGQRVKVKAALPTPKRVERSDKRYMNKKDFGKVPNYLRRVQRDIQAEKNVFIEAERERLRREEAARGREYTLDEDERCKLVEELKIKWDSYNAQYQLQAHVVNLDTAGKIQRKEYLEKMLKRVEKAIETLERGPVQIFCKPVQ
ncbi:Enkurin [Hondaea fermentalgiana]|uniref:Enkurin n=1 Tax=Hondaea fermentalgiana TaxID=2315210 RepID=A0A2R5GCX3_9STRA|nr:Enkurin [Hondaea fermentalgiana]|eukprot:GBG25624.1 Enkurin [Hondaea fermentalgiana]